MKIIQYLLIISLIGCTGHMTKLSQGKNVVWADDNSEAATVVSHPEKNLHKISVHDIKTGEKRDITEWRDYKSGQIFYMKQAGYFIVESLLQNGARRFDKIEENGNEILIIETPDDKNQPCSKEEKAQIYHTVIPSPNGLQLAHIYSPECGAVTIEFLYANNLNIFDTQTMNIDEPMRVKWHSDNYIILVNYNNDKAWKVTPVALPMPILPPQCFGPVTTSSNVSLNGEQVLFDGDKLITKSVDTKFGCQ
ncbi:hypothetical protein QUF74_18945 [Candidatus Halobeggiatoa sp. HSG11]|nr:hypothetical protein [Candidatus Halobeggiatoa sp. HSG11]